MQSDIRFLSGELSGAKLTIVAGMSPLIIENKKHNKIANIFGVKGRNIPIPKTPIKILENIIIFFASISRLSKIDEPIFPTILERITAPQTTPDCDADIPILFMRNNGKNVNTEKNIIL